MLVTGECSPLGARRRLVVIVILGMLLTGCSSNPKAGDPHPDARGATCSFGEGVPSLATSWAHAGAECSLYAPNQVPSESEIERGCTRTTFADGTGTTWTADWAPHILRDGTRYTSFGDRTQVATVQPLLAYAGKCGKSTRVLTRVEELRDLQPEVAVAQRSEGGWQVFISEKHADQPREAVPTNLRNLIWPQFQTFEMDVIHLRGL